MRFHRAGASFLVLGVRCLFRAQRRTPTNNEPASLSSSAHGEQDRRIYRTPLNLFRRGDDYFFFLTYGSDVQWAKNVLAAGSCSIETRGRVVDLLEPELVTDGELRPAPPHVRFVEGRIAGATQYVRMRASSST
jgi:hypothetical protein